MNTYEKIFSKSVSLWTIQPATQNAIRNRLGWLDAPEFSRQSLESLENFKSKVLKADFKQIVLIGMGGSSLAPEVFNRFANHLGDDKTKLDLIVLDGTCPDQIETLRKQIDLPTSLFIVASKSGGTIETRFLFDYFFAEIAEISSNPGSQFVAITDSGSALEKVAQKEIFFALFINPSDIGGRYSALSYFGLVPAVLLGWDIEKLLDRADQAIDDNKTGSGLGVQLGEWLTKDYLKPIDILLFRYESPELEAFFMWIEQLVAESLGKSGEGVFLAKLSSQGELKSDNSKCLKLDFNIDGPDNFDFSQSNNATVCIRDPYDIAAHFFHWEMATAIAAVHIGVNPFDEPNVAEAKQKTSQLLSRPEEIELPETIASLPEFFLTLSASEYLAILVYAEDSLSNRQEVLRIQKAIEKHVDMPVTVNFGPRYLHSVGQLHKGGKQHGAFLVILDLPELTIQIPGQTYGFEKLFCAQAIGDFQILREKGLPTEFITIDKLADIDI